MTSQDSFPDYHHPLYFFECDGKEYSFLSIVPAVIFRNLSYSECGIFSPGCSSHGSPFPIGVAQNYDGNTILPKP
jgi:hypothetical protein